MYVFLPDKKDGLQDLVQNFNSTPELLGDCFEVKEENLSKMWIPKFKFSYGFDASRIMQNIGLTSQEWLILLKVKTFFFPQYYTSLLLKLMRKELRLQL